MVATNEKVQFDFNADFGDSNYKSCFARSVVVNSQFQTKSLDVRQLQKESRDEQDKRMYPSEEFAISHDMMRLRKDYQGQNDEAARRLSCCSNSSGGGSTAGGRSRRGSDLPVENIALQSQVDKLQWQLKQAEASREMYRAVMQQVVSFLERAHRSLDVLSEKQRVVQRSRSEYHVAQASNSCNSVNETIGEGDTLPSGLQEPRASVDGYTAFRDFTWRRAKRLQTGPDEIPPEKLSQEAFRLLRTAQSLISTREPDLAHICPDLPPKDQDFLSQLAREFPSRPPQRATSFSVNPQLISPSDRDIRIQTAFNRKLSLQRSPDNRRNSIHHTHNLISEYSKSTMSSNDLDRAPISPVTRRNSLRHEIHPTSDYSASNDSVHRTQSSQVTRRNSLRHELFNPAIIDSNGANENTQFYSVSRRNSLRHEKHSDYSSIATNESESKRSSVTSIPSIKKSEKSYFDGVITSDKSGSPKTGSVSSAEDESGFSSMNSFQEVGLPLINSTLLDTSDLLFKNEGISVNSSDSNITQICVDTSDTKIIDKSKLIWNRSDLGLPITHRRWSSTPVEVTQNDPLKVLWV